MNAPMVATMFQNVEAVAVLVGVGAAGHALQAEDVHRAEGQVEADAGSARSATLPSFSLSM